jgi:hypothetical protein
MNGVVVIACGIRFQQTGHESILLRARSICAARE